MRKNAPIFGQNASKPAKQIALNSFPDLFAFKIISLIKF
jgi:hypothetical protein